MPMGMPGMGMPGMPTMPGMPQNLGQNQNGNPVTPIQLQVGPGSLGVNGITPVTNGITAPGDSNADDYTTQVEERNKEDDEPIVYASNEERKKAFTSLLEESLDDHFKKFNNFKIRWDQILKKIETDKRFNALERGEKGRTSLTSWCSGWRS